MIFTISMGLMYLVIIRLSTSGWKTLSILRSPRSVNYNKFEIIDYIRKCRLLFGSDAIMNPLFLLNKYTGSFCIQVGYGMVGQIWARMKVALSKITTLSYSQSHSLPALRDNKVTRSVTRYCVIIRVTASLRSVTIHTVYITR